VIKSQPVIDLQMQPPVTLPPSRRHRWRAVRRPAVAALVGLLALLPPAAVHTHHAAAGPADPAIAVTEPAIERAAGFLVAQQQNDGSWRSGHYAQFADGVSLTAHVALQLHRSGHADLRQHARAIEFLLTHNNGMPEPHEPVHTTALMLELLARAETPDVEALQTRVERLSVRRLSAANGHPPGHPDHGGWSYALIDPPARDRAPIPSPFSANLSATRFAIDAALAVHERAPALMPEQTLAEWTAAAAALALRCQNTPARGPADGTGIDGRPIVFNDGGFFFSPSDPALNKAGALQPDRPGGQRFHSYGSATSDALWLLLRTGHEPGHPAVRSGMTWLDQRLTDAPPGPAAIHPGRFPRDREILRFSYEYYFLMNSARLLEEWDRQAGLTDWQSAWAVRMRDVLIERQQRDGSWSNPRKEGREDDPLVATPMALAALTSLQAVLPTARDVPH